MEDVNLWMRDTHKFLENQAPLKCNDSTEFINLLIYLPYQFIFSQKHIIGNIDHTPSHWASLFSWIIYALNFHHLFHAVNFFSLFHEVNFIQWCDCQHHLEQKPLIVTWTSILCFGNSRVLLLQKVGWIW